MSASSGKATVLPKKVTELDPTNSRYPSFNYPRSRFELALVLAIMTSFWRIHCIGNRQGESENESFWSASVQSHSWLAFVNLFPYISGFRLFLLLLQLNHLSTCYSPLFSKLREKHEGNGSFDSKRSWCLCEGDVEVLFKSCFFLSSGLGSNGLKEDCTSTVNILK